MGFGANLFLMFTWPVLLIIAIVVIYRNRNNLNFWKFSGIGVVSLIVLVTGLKFFTTKTVLEADDFYGEYIVDRSYFPGPEADWQYNHCRFTITKDNKIYLDITDGNRHIKTFTGTVKIIDGYVSDRLTVSMDDYTHIISSFNSSPTIYRSIFHFHLVFKSPWYHNMYFKKGKWKPL